MYKTDKIGLYLCIVKLKQTHNYGTDDKTRVGERDYPHNQTQLYCVTWAIPTIFNAFCGAV